MGYRIIFSTGSYILPPEGAESVLKELFIDDKGIELFHEMTGSRVIKICKDFLRDLEIESEEYQKHGKEVITNTQIFLKTLLTCAILNKKQKLIVEIN